MILGLSLIKFTHVLEDCASGGKKSKFARVFLKYVFVSGVRRRETEREREREREREKKQERERERER